MRKLKTVLIILVLFSVFAVGSVAAEDEPTYVYAIGIGGEVNKNTVEEIAAGGLLTFDFTPLNILAIGGKTAFSYNLDSLGTLETGIFIRLYFVSWNSSGPFIQGDFGLSSVFRRDDTHENLYTELMYGGTLGWRIHIGSFYLEPYGRGGVPFIWGGGLIFGKRL